MLVSVRPVLRQEVPLTAGALAAVGTAGAGTKRLSGTSRERGPRMNPPHALCQGTFWSCVYVGSAQARRAREDHLRGPRGQAESQGDHRRSRGRARTSSHRVKPPASLSGGLTRRRAQHTDSDLRYSYARLARIHCTPSASLLILIPLLVGGCASIGSQGALPVEEVLLRAKPAVVLLTASVSADVRVDCEDGQTVTV